MAKKARIGSGKRFKALTKSLASKGARSPKGLAAVIGRRKYGSAGMAAMAAAGRRRKR